MTRPSEAEVTEAMVEAGVAAMEGHAPRLVSRAPEYNDPMAVALRYSFVRNILTAALSTPPLPSAEPVAWLREDGAATSPFAKREWPELNAAFTTPVYTTPPAAAQDTVRLDWLEASHGDARYMWARRWEVIVKRDNKHTLDAAPTLRAAIDKSMGAARAAGGE